MKCDEVKSYLDEYFEESLNPDLQDKIQKHLEECKDCENEYKLLNNFLLQARYLKTGVTIPSEILDGISDELIRQSETETGKDKSFNKTQLNQIKKAIRQEIFKDDSIGKKIEKSITGKKIDISGSKKGIIWFVIVLIISIAAYVLYEISRFNAPWEIKLEKGIYKINNSVPASEEINERDILSTGINSSVMVNIPLTGRFELYENSSVSLVQGKDGANIIMLKEGTMLISSRVFQPKLTILTNLVSIEDPGSSFKVTVLRNGSNKVDVIIGRIILASQENKIDVAEGYICEIDENNGIGIPYHRHARENFKIALYNYQRGENINQNVRVMLESAKESDSLTLLHLLQKIEFTQRLAIYDKLAGFYPIPDGVTQEGILQLDKKMMKSWWKEIEWQL